MLLINHRTVELSIDKGSGNILIIVLCRVGETGGRALVGFHRLPLFCQAKLYVVLDFKISIEVSNFEVINSIY